MVETEAVFQLAPEARVMEIIAGNPHAMHAGRDILELDVDEPFGVAWSAGAVDTRGIQRAFDAVAPRLPAWAEDVMEWGPDTSSRLQVYLADSQVEQLALRLDLRKPNAPFVLAALRVAADLSLRLITVDGYAIAPTGDALAWALRSSEALAYAPEPITLLRDLRQASI